jgi:TRAP-type mannitol/chloroaromatic compound transport system substrate-binding protein
MTDIQKGSGRRNMLKGAAVAAGAMTAPMISRAQTVSMRFQSTWPAKDIFHEYANDFASKVNNMASGRLKIEVLPSGSVVPAFQLLDAVNKGTLDGGHGVLAYHYGKKLCFGFVGFRPCFWHGPQYGSLMAPIWRRQTTARRNLQVAQYRRGFLCLWTHAYTAFGLVQKANR